MKQKTKMFGEVRVNNCVLAAGKFDGEYVQFLTLSSKAGPVLSVISGRETEPRTRYGLHDPVL